MTEFRHENLSILGPAHGTRTAPQRPTNTEAQFTWPQAIFTHGPARSTAALLAAITPRCGWWSLLGRIPWAGPASITMNLGGRRHPVSPKDDGNLRILGSMPRLSARRMIVRLLISTEN